MIKTEICKTIREIVRGAPAQWLSDACQVLRSAPDNADVRALLAKLPVTNNADLAHNFTKIINGASGHMSWEALGCAIEFSAESLRASGSGRSMELLWSGPIPGDSLSARRIDQVLYDLIQASKREVLLVTFAAFKIARLAEVLKAAVARGVKVRLILEFEETSEGGLSFDAIHAFPAGLIETLTVYCWPTEKRDRNAAGRPGKLHAKVAQVDENVIVSSANLTDDAFTRNMEMGLFVANADLAERVKAYFASLISKGVLREI